MKTIFRLLLIVSILAGTRVASGQLNPKALLLDSVYSYNWVGNSWSLNTKNFLNKNGSGQTIQSLFKTYDTGSGQFLDYVRFLYDYSGSTWGPSTITNQFWNSTLWSTYQYTHYLAEEIIDTTFLKNWDSHQHKLTTGSKNTYQYNDSLLPVENIIQVWDTVILDWVKTAKITFSYTATMQPSDRIILTWQNSTSTWVNVYKYSEVYDGSNALVGHFEYAWSDSASNWISTVRVSYYNNPTLMPYLEVKELWNSSLHEWDSLEQSTYIYNQFNWLMTVLKQAYQQNTGTWVNNYLTFNTYSPGGIQQSTTGNVWDTIHMTWIPDHYQLLDSATQKLAETYTRFVDPQTFLIPSGSRNLYIYTSTGDTATKINQKWDVSGSDWINNTQVTYDYDSHNLLTGVLTLNWESTSSSWLNAKKSDYYYSEFIGIGEHSLKEKPCFYSNPMVAGNSINCPDFRDGNEYTLKVCSLSGMEVYRTAFRGGEVVTISKSLASGLYFLIIEENNRIIYKDKIVILR